jgi:anti-sigma B factor antagonist
MTIKPRKVTVELLPRNLGSDRGQATLSKLFAAMDAIRPFLVLDCSRLTSMDHTAVSFLLCCLEEALKRNGDVRLAGLSPAARTILQSTGADRLFRIFASQAEAVSSFHRPLHIDSMQTTQEEVSCTSENAA